MVLHKDIPIPDYNGIKIPTEEIERITTFLEGKDMLVRQSIRIVGGYYLYVLTEKSREDVISAIGQSNWAINKK